MNNTILSMIGMNQKIGNKRGTFPLKKTYPKESIVPEHGLYRYLYQPGEQHGD